MAIFFFVAALLPLFVALVVYVVDNCGLSTSQLHIYCCKSNLSILAGEFVMLDKRFITYGNIIMVLQSTHTGRWQPRHNRGVNSIL